MRVQRLFIFCLSFLFIGVLSLYSQAGLTNNNISVKLPAEEVSFLDTFQVEYTVAGYDGIAGIRTNYVFSEFSLDIEVLSLSSNSFTLNVTSYEITNFFLPPLIVSAYSNTENASITNAFLTPLYEISAVTTNSSGKLESIEEIVDIKDYRWIWLVLLAMLLIGGIVLLVFWLDSKIKQKVKEAEKAIDPYKEYTEALERIKRMSVDEDNYKEFYVNISESVRRFVERIMGFNALEMASSEIKRTLFKEDADTDLSEIILYVLKNCDRVKYAKHVPGLDQRKAVLAESRALLDKAEELFKRPEEKDGNHQQTDTKQEKGETEE